MKLFDSFIKMRVIILLMIPIHLVTAQSSVVMVPSQSSVIIKGTSSLHDWEEKVEKFNVNLILKFSEKDISGIDHVHFTCKSESIISENSIMTHKTHDALQVKKYPDITFMLATVDQLTSQNGNFSGTLVGDVTVAGITKRITILFSGMRIGDKISIKGSKELNMNDYKIKPPTAILGTLKTGEQITIDFQLQFQVS